MYIAPFHSLLIVHFSVLAKIVKHMRTRYQQGDRYGLTLEEILDETHQTDVGLKTKGCEVPGLLLGCSMQE